MMKIDILSLFPEMFEGFLNTSIIKRAIDKEVVDIKIHNFREFTQDKHCLLYTSSLRLNDQQIESTVEEDLITTNDYVSKVISNINIENRDDIIDLYAKSSEMAITCYSNSEGYVAYGNKKYNPTRCV